MQTFFIIVYYIVLYCLCILACFLFLPPYNNKHTDVSVSVSLSLSFFRSLWMCSFSLAHRRRKRRCGGPRGCGAAGTSHPVVGSRRPLLPRHRAPRARRWWGSPGSGAILFLRCNFMMKMTAAEHPEVGHIHHHREIVPVERTQKNNGNWASPVSVRFFCGAIS